MTKIQRVEDIESWQAARGLTRQVYSAAKRKEMRGDFALRDQLCRAAVSVMANIAEGFGRRSNKDFANFLYMAKGSATEVISHIYVALDQGHLDQPSFDQMKDGYESVIRKLVNFIRNLESKDSERFSTRK